MKKHIRTVLIGLSLGSAGIAIGAINLTTFTAGTPIRAAEVNANFVALKTGIETASGINAGAITPDKLAAGIGADKLNIAGAAGDGKVIKSQGGALAYGESMAVLLHQGTAANTTENFSCIDNPATNGKPNARILITANWNPSGGSSGVYVNAPLGVFYMTNTSSPFVNKWCVFTQLTPGAPILNMPTNAAFNVLVFNS